MFELDGRRFRAHGTPAAYNKGCRCAECRECNRARCAAVKAALSTRPPSEVPHGPHAYVNYGCRCEVCAEANSARSRDYRLRRRPVSAMGQVGATDAD
jgi:hypothetical protein